MRFAVSILLLCVSPIILSGLVGGTLYWIRGFRRSFGAHRGLPGSAILVAIGLGIVHGGYFIAPLLYRADCIGLALWLVAPVAIVASLVLVWHLLFNSMSFAPDAPERFRRKSLVVAGLLATYLVPVFVLLLNLK